jgi:MFS family permease
MVIPLIISTIVTGQLVSRIGYYTPFLIFGVCLASIGSGLLTTLEIDTSEGIWIGFQIVYGFGLGCCAQAPNMAAQTVLPREDVAIGASLMFFGQQLFGAIFTTVGQSTLDNQLTDRLANFPNITPELIQNTGATELLNLIPTEDHTAVLNAYNDSLRVCFRVALILACTSILGALFMEWRSVKKNLPKEATPKEGVTEEGKAEHGSCQEDGGNAEAKSQQN